MVPSVPRKSFSTSLCCVMAAALVFAGCAPSRNSSASRPAGSRNSTVITREEIRTAGAANAYDLVQSLRPNWLNKRGPQTLTDVTLTDPRREGDIMVYLDVARLGGLSALREVPASSLMLVEFLDATKANYRFGRGHPYGAILLSPIPK